MNKKILIFLIFLSLVMLPYNVKAKSCSIDEKNKINSLINNIKITYEHISNNEFKINIYNIPEELYVLTPSQKKFEHNANNLSVDTNYSGGRSYTFEIFSSNNNYCIDEMNYTKTIYIKKYNKYSEKEICKNEKYKNFNYCNKWYQGNITDSKFETELKKFEQTMQSNNQTVEIENNNTSNKIKIIVILSVIILVFVIFISMLIMRKRRKRKI